VVRGAGGCVAGRAIYLYSVHACTSLRRGGGMSTSPPVLIWPVEPQPPRAMDARWFVRGIFLAATDTMMMMTATS
jgi:hypothetical protein